MYTITRQHRGVAGEVVTGSVFFMTFKPSYGWVFLLFISSLYVPF